MELAHLRELSELEQSYWWHVAKRDLVTGWLQEFVPPPGRLIEGGLGSAGNLVSWQEQGYDVTGLDILPEAVAYGRQRGLTDMHVHDLEQPWPVEPARACAVVLLDVIEHVNDPVAVLQQAYAAIEPGGVVIVTVPAYGWLYGDWDRALGHHRRYSRRMLREQARQAGFQLVRATHWNSFTLPAAIGVRTWQKLRPAERPAEFPRVSAAVNRLLQQCAAVERQVSRYVPIPCGLSIACVLKKNGEQNQ